MTIPIDQVPQKHRETAKNILDIQQALRDKNRGVLTAQWALFEIVRNNMSEHKHATPQTSEMWADIEERHDALRYAVDWILNG